MRASLIAAILVGVSTDIIEQAATSCTLGNRGDFHVSQCFVSEIKEGMASFQKLPT